MEKRTRVLLSKVGTDTHDRGIKIIARALRDAGLEVIYIGLYQTTEQLVQAAVQEDVEFVGVSSLNGGHMSIFPEIVAGLKKQGRSDIHVLAGGVIPQHEAVELKTLGVAEVFRAGTNTGDVVNFIKAHTH